MLYPIFHVTYHVSYSYFPMFVARSSMHTPSDLDSSTDLISFLLSVLVVDDDDAVVVVPFVGCCYTTSSSY